jgi:predicted PurR-regulated permease PerM
MSYRKFQTYFFITVLSLSLLLTLAVFQSYLVLLAFGGVLAVISRPLFWRFQALFKGEGMPAFLTILCVSLIFLLPLAYLSTVLVAEILDVISGIRVGIASEGVVQALQNWLPVSVHQHIPTIIDGANNFLQSAKDGLFQGGLGVFSDAFKVVLGFFVVMISGYYLLKDGARLKKEILLLSPLGDDYDELVIERVALTVRAVMGGMLVIAVVKAVVAGLTFWIAGVPAPSFWGAMTGMSAFIPVVGSALVTVPIALYLLFVGKIGAAIAITIVSVLIIGTIDNFLQPKLVQSKTSIHPLLILLSILGGIQFYGFSGFILGPLTLSVSVVLIDIFKKEFRRYLEKE